MTWGPTVTVVSPEGLRAELVTLLGDLLKRHDPENGAT